MDIRESCAVLAERIGLGSRIILVLQNSLLDLHVTLGPPACLEYSGLLPYLVFRAKHHCQ